MDLERGKLNPGDNNYQIQGSWIPVTSNKTMLQTSQPIYIDQRYNQLGNANWTRTDGFSAGFVSFDSTNWLEANNWEANLAGRNPDSGSNAGGNQQVNNDPLASWNSIPFVDLLAQASMKSNPTQMGVEDSYDFGYNSQIGSSWPESAYGSPNLSLASELWTDHTFAPQMTQCELPIPCRKIYDLNALPGAIAEDLPCSGTILQFAPITPDKRANHENQNINEVDTTRANINELYQDQTLSRADSSFPAISTTVTEIHSPEKEIDLNATPQQKAKRKKHRPKVITEKPKRVRKPPAVPKPDGSTGKRKYVKKGTEKMSSFSEAADGKNSEPVNQFETTAKTAKRVLNFDGEGQGRNENFVGQASSIPTPTNTNMPCVNVNANAHTQNAGQVTSDGKLGSPNDSNCSTTNGQGPSTLKRRWVNVIDLEDPRSTMNLRGAQYEDLHSHEPHQAHNYNNGITRMCFTENPKKRKIVENGHLSTASSISSSVFTAKNVTEIARERVQNCTGANILESRSNNWIPVPPRVQTTNRASITTTTQEEAAQAAAMNRLAKNRMMGPTRVQDWASLIGTTEKQPLLNGEAQRVVETCSILANRNSKKQNYVINFGGVYQNNDIYTQHRIPPKQHIGPRSVGILKTFTVDAITERLKHLHINNQENNALVPCNTSYPTQNALVPYLVNKKQDKNALVLYKREGTIVTYDESLYPIKKRRPRPKVDLDDETTRVWNLLLENINSEGIDGTNEQKTRWWENERTVFCGRADSFIARMHLVQGDRRFSKWKGSVLDSVVGVFLTQNVSDHLSSSAFMSMAAHFPLHKKSNEQQQCHDEKKSILVEEPELCILDLEDTAKWKETTSDNLVSDQSCLSSNDDFKNKVDSFIGNFHESTTAIQQHIEEVISSQSSVDSSMAEKGSGNSQETGPKSASFDGSTSCMELLQKINQSHNNQETCLIQSENSSVDSQDIIQRSNNLPINLSEKKQLQSSNDESMTQGKKIVFQKKTLQNSPGEISDVTESTSLFNTGAKTSNLNEQNKGSVNVFNETTKRKRVAKEKKDDFDWDSLRKQAQANGVREKTANTMDSLDWEAVRCADVGEIAQTIRERGMNNMLAERIKEFLNRLLREHGSLDLEWLRDVPPDKAKEYLLSIRGLGLKSVECVRLLTLHHLAFPVDTNVGRIAVRLGWVPLQPLPESLQLHLLEMYPILESIQKYLWPRLCKLDQKTLYELHYQMITFGKVFCTKSKPNCNACPMRGECRHFASAFASARLALPGPEEKGMVTASATENAVGHNSDIITSRLQLPPPPQVNHQYSIEISQSEANTSLEAKSISKVRNNEPIIEEPATPPEPECTEITEVDIEDAFLEDPDEIPTIKLNIEKFTQNLQDYMQNNMELQEADMSRALVALSNEAASLPTPKLKNISRLRTEHQVYELPDSHPLLHGFDKREPDDPSSYLLAIWTPGENENSIQPPEGCCSSQEAGTLCFEASCFSCNNIREANSQIVRGTILVPCRTAMRGSFPLNGTYFQVNEVFADHDSSLTPIDVPRAWIWNLPRRTVYFGTSIPTIFKGLTTEGIQYCFWRGFVCVRGFDQKSRAPRPLRARLHFPASRLARTTKGTTNEE